MADIASVDVSRVPEIISAIDGLDVHLPDQGLSVVLVAIFATQSATETAVV